jgi:hypothetical protein
MRGSLARGVHAFRRVRLALLVALASTEARAEEPFWKAHDATILTTGASIANAAGLLPGIGIGIGIGNELPSKNWSFAGAIAGSAQVTFGALSIARGATEREHLWLAGYGAATVLLGLTNMVLGFVNLARHDRAWDRLDTLDPRFSVAPLVPPESDGIGLAIAVTAD